MSAPIIISGTTGSDRRFCQFWGPYKIAGRSRDECLASMSSSDGLEVDSQCPPGWLTPVWEAYTLLVAGGIPVATHTVVWGFGRPTFSTIEVEPGATLFDIDGART